MQTKLLLLGIFLIIVSGMGYFFSRSTQSASFRNIRIHNQTFTVEVADTDQQRVQGLSGRNSIGSAGMLFVFDEPGRPGFWMKDMLIDLDFIWIRDNQVVHIMTDVPKPAEETALSQLPVYVPDQEVDAMLEVAAGFVAEYQIVVGDSIELL